MRKPSAALPFTRSTKLARDCGAPKCLYTEKSEPACAVPENVNREDGHLFPCNPAREAFLQSEAPERACSVHCSCTRAALSRSVRWFSPMRRFHEARYCVTPFSSPPAKVDTRPSVTSLFNSLPASSFNSLPGYAPSS